MNPIARLFVEVGANTNQFQKGMTQVRDEINSVSKQASFFNTTLSNAIGTGLGILATQATDKLMDTVAWIKKTGEEFNSLKENSYLAFETMLGSGKQAEQFLNDLSKFAERTPFELPGLIDSSQKMIAFGFTAKQVIPTLTAIGDAVSGLGGSPEKLNRVITAIGQIQAKGKVQAQEMLQLAETGIPAWEILAKHLGVTIPEAMKLSEKGAIDAGTAINALITGMNQKFGGLMAKQSKTFSGLKSTFNDLLRDVAARVTKPWFDNAKKGLERMIALMQSDKFQSFVTRITKISERAAGFVAKIKHSVIDFFIHGFSGIKFNFLDLLPEKLKGISKYFKPITEFIYNLADKGFRVLTGVFDSFYRSFNKIGNQKFYFFGDMSIEEFAHGIKSIFNDINSGGKNLNYWLYTAPKAFQVITRVMLAARSVFNYFSGEGLQATLKKLGSILSSLGNTLAKLVRPFKDALGGLFNQLASMKSMGFADIFKAIISSVIQAFSGFIEVIKNEFWPSIKAAFEYIFTNLWNYFTTIDWSNVWDSTVKGFNSLVSFISSIDWSSLGQLVITGFNAIVGYVQSVDWEKVWSTVWTGLSAVGSWINENVVPIFTGFFNWLVSWFNDPSKSQTLYNAVSTTWNFLSSWASAIVSAIEPYLSSFYNWLSSWFNDSNKNTQLLNGISTVWNFVTEWAGKLINWVSVPLGAFFNWLLSWVTDSSKRSQLWNGITTTWNWAMQWASSLVSWVTPYLSQFWNWITGWFTDPNKNTSMLQALGNGWTALKTWSAALWGWISPNLSTLASNLKQWIDDNHPQFGSWIDAFVKFSTDSRNQWERDFPEIVKQFIYLRDTLLTETPKILETLERLSSRFGDGWNYTTPQWFAGLEHDLADAEKMISKFLEIIDAMVATTQSAFSLDWTGYVNNSMLFGQRLTEFGQIWNQNQQFWQNLGNSVPTGIPGHAKGGIAEGGRILVGEKGPEIVDLPKGSRISDAGQTRGILQSNTNAYVNTPLPQANSRVDVYIHNESKIPLDRNTVKELAQALQRELNLSGNRVVFAN